MSKKRIVIMLDAPAWVMAEDGFLKIGYTNRGSDSFKIDQYEFMFVERVKMFGSIDSMSVIRSFLGVDQQADPVDQGEKVSAPKQNKGSKSKFLIDRL